MLSYIETVRDHYQAGIADDGALFASLASALDGMGAAMSAQTLAGFDQFHVGGLAATVELAQRVKIAGTVRVLDAGSGLGGPSRYLAETFGCTVFGIDLSPTFVRIAELLAERSGVDAKLSYRAGSITELPFEAASFDLVWTQHVVMNIRDRVGLYRELRRVLTPGGRLAFYDPYAPDDHQPLLYPVPWADDASTSTLLTRNETISALEDGGFALSSWSDVTDTAKEWAAQQQRRLQQVPEQTSLANGLNLGMVVGPRMLPMVANFGRNITEGRVRLVMGICNAA